VAIAPNALCFTWYQKVRSNPSPRRCSHLTALLAALNLQDNLRHDDRFHSQLGKQL
jgi:hypothetical protein